MASRPSVSYHRGDSVVHHSDRDAYFVLLLASFGAAAHAASLYKTRIEGEARQFADVAFRRIFTEHDTYFLLGHLTKHAEEQAGGRGRVTRFLQDATMHAGDVHDITRATGNARLSYRFPDELASEARMGALAVGAPGPLSLHLICGEAGGDWQIDQIWWVSETESPSPAR
ncbi:MAG: hypothetical protein H0U99_00565 [Chthoniobacterales bacterium]|nr:hypothetical protein [Chthoniobacterales bacterium]